VEPIYILVTASEPIANDAGVIIPTLISVAII